MSLRFRILSAILIVNLVVLGAFAFIFMRENRRARENTAAHDLITALRSRGLDVLLRARRGRESSNGEWNVDKERRAMQRILDYEFPARIQDALIADAVRVTDSREDYLYVYFNPLGAYHRNHATFRRDVIRDGLDWVMQTGEQRSALGGVCRPITSRDGRLLGAGWCKLKEFSVPELPVMRLVWTVAIGMTVLVGVTYVALSRWILTPLARLSDAAGKLETGRLGERAEADTATREITAVVNTFNRASVILHESERRLEQAVEEATNRARRRERELIRSQRLAALGTLAAGIAHEINNPLGGMMNAVNRLNRKERSESDQVYLKLLEEGLDRVRRIVSRALEFAPRTMQPVPFQIRESALRAKALIQHRLERMGVEFVIDGIADAVVGGDPHELTQVFLNLFLNSLDAFEDQMPAEPEIHVTVSDLDVSDGPEHGYMIRVRDNGPGADAETVERIFDPFYSSKGATSKSEKLSSGLGMSISFAIVEQHGGRMTVVSEPGQGFETRIELPRYRRSTEEL